MSRFDPDHMTEGPQIQMAPLIDIVFITLILFMTLSVYYQIETQIDIQVPRASQAVDVQRSPTAMVININTTGEYLINGVTYSSEGLDGLLKKLVLLAPDQSVIIRADEKTFHKFIIETLDMCARNNIRDISFATSNQTSP